MSGGRGIERTKNQARDGDGLAVLSVTSSWVMEGMAGAVRDCAAYAERESEGKGWRALFARRGRRAKSHRRRRAARVECGVAKTNYTDKKNKNFTASRPAPPPPHLLHAQSPTPARNPPTPSSHRTAHISKKRCGPRPPSARLLGRSPPVGGRRPSSRPAAPPHPALNPSRARSPRRPTSPSWMRRA